MGSLHEIGKSRGARGVTGDSVHRVHQWHQVIHDSGRDAPSASRYLFGNPGAAAGQTWIAENAMMMAIVWPLLIVAVTLPLAVHRYQGLSR